MAIIFGKEINIRHLRNLPEQLQLSCGHKIRTITPHASSTLQKEFSRMIKLDLLTITCTPMALTDICIKQNKSSVHLWMSATNITL